METLLSRSLLKQSTSYDFVLLRQRVFLRYQVGVENCFKVTRISAMVIHKFLMCTCIILSIETLKMIRNLLTSPTISTIDITLYTPRVLMQIAMNRATDASIKNHSEIERF